MSIEHSGVIDALSLDRDSRLVMAIWNPLDWNIGTFIKLQTKINAYLASGYADNFLARRPDRSAREFEIKLISRHEPDPQSEILLRRLVDFQAKQGLTLSYETATDFTHLLYQGDYSQHRQNVEIRTARGDRNEYRVAKRELATAPPQVYVYHCFVSYTTREEEVRQIKPYVDDLIGELQARGLRVCPVFYDGFYLRDSHYADEELRAHLRQAVELSAFMVTFLSPGYFTSKWCAYEVEANDREHRRRGHPASEWSLLPIEWKESNAPARFRRYARYLRIDPSWSSQAAALDAAGRYVREWYPEATWVFDHRF